MQRLLEMLKSSDPSARNEAIDALTDIVEYGEISKNECESAANLLIDYVVKRESENSLGAYLNLLSMISSKNFDKPLSADFDRLVSVISKLDDQNKEYAISVLGFSRDPSFISVIEPFKSSDDESVSAAANEALAEIRHSLPK